MSNSTIIPFSLNAVFSDKLAGQTKIFSKEMFEYYLYVEYTRDLPNTCELLGVYQVMTNDKDIKLSSTSYTRQTGRYTIKFLSSALAGTTGYHRYKILLLDPSTSITYTLYFAYIVQTTEETRDYIYMRR